MVGILFKGAGNVAQQLLLDFQHVFTFGDTGTVRNAKICVSTAIVGWPKAVFKITLAVLRPTPGSACKVYIVGNLAAVLIDQQVAGLH